MISGSLLVRITRVYKYKPDDVVLGAVFIHPSTMSTKPGVHRIVILTNQASLNITPKPGQQWEIKKENNYAVRQEQAPFGGFIEVYRFMAPTLKCVLPDNGDGFVRFLTKEKVFKGIGEQTAQMLWYRFQAKLFNLLEAGPDAVINGQTHFELIKEVVLKESAVKGLFEGYKEYKNLKYASELVSFDIEAPVQQQLFRMAEEDAMGYLKSNPYRLYSLGMTFSKVDVIAQKHFQVKRDSCLRLKAIVEQALRWWGEKGNTVAHWSDIEWKVSDLLEGDVKLVNLAKQQKGEIIGFVKEDEKYYISGNYIFEKTIAKRFLSLSKERWGWNQDLEDAFNVSKPKGWDLNDLQKRAVRTALTNSIFVLSGGAGTGKTTTLETIVNAYRELGFTIYPVALSGKASRRLEQSIGIKTRTIAKLLHTENQTEDKCVLLIDEASMIDSYTMWRLVILFGPETRILLVGDPYQLAPINAGFVLSDVIKSGVIPSIELQEVKRQKKGSSINSYAMAIRQGKWPSPTSTDEITFTEPVGNNVEQVVEISSQYSNAMIVAPTNDLVRKVNVAAQHMLNPDGESLNLEVCVIEKGSYDFKLGDPIVVTLTCYKNDVQNGTLGKIVDVSTSEEYACTVELEDYDEHGTLRVLKVDWNLFEYLDLAYCLTLHKLQGSQAENVIVLVDDSLLIDRSWLYTSVTRTENKLHIISTQSDFNIGLSRAGAIDTRKTGLADMLVGNH